MDGTTRYEHAVPSSYSSCFAVNIEIKHAGFHQDNGVPQILSGRAIPLEANTNALPTPVFPAHSEQIALTADNVDASDYVVTHLQASIFHILAQFRNHTCHLMAGGIGNFDCLKNAVLNFVGPANFLPLLRF